MINTKKQTIKIIKKKTDRGAIPLPTRFYSDTQFDKTFQNSTILL